MKRNALEPVLKRWMNLEPIMQNEVSQEEKHKYCILHTSMESRGMVLMNLFTEPQWRRRHSEQTCDIVGEGEAGTNELSEWLGNIYIPKCKPIFTMRKNNQNFIFY